MSMQTENWEPISPFQDVEMQGIASNLSHRINLPKSFALENQPNPMLVFRQENFDGSQTLKI
jgi:hypothetical protein